MPAIWEQKIPISLCSILRIPVSLYNVDEKDVFRPNSWNALGSDPEGADYRACATYGPLCGRYS